MSFYRCSKILCSVSLSTSKHSPCQAEKLSLRILWQITTNFGVVCSRASGSESGSEDGCCYPWIHSSLLLQLLKPALLLFSSPQPSSTLSTVVSAQSHTVTSVPRSIFKLVSIIWLQRTWGFWLNMKLQNVTQRVKPSQGGFGFVFSPKKKL